MEDNEILCSLCFENVLQVAVGAPAVEITSQNRTEMDYELQHPHDTNVCVWCRNSLFGRRIHSLPEGPERDFIIARISPREVSSPLLYFIIIFTLFSFGVDRGANTRDLTNMTQPFAVSGLVRDIAFIDVFDEII